MMCDCRGILHARIRINSQCFRSLSKISLNYGGSALAKGVWLMEDGTLNFQIMGSVVKGKKSLIL
mgnify:FL=1